MSLILDWKIGMKKVNGKLTANLLTFSSFEMKETYFYPTFHRRGKSSLEKSIGKLFITFNLEL
jgi:hypothetical protein